MGIGVLTNVGLTEMLNAQANDLAFEFNTVKVSSDLIAPDAGTTAMTNVVYTCVSSQVQQLVLNTNTIRTVVTLLTDVGDFTVGTVGLYTGAGTLFAFAQFPGAGQKTASDPPASVGNIRVFYVDVVYDGIASIPTLGGATGVTMRQLRTALNDAGQLGPATSALESAEYTSQASINWFSCAQNNSVGDPLFVFLASTLGLTDGGAALFDAAQALSPP